MSSVAAATTTATRATTMELGLKPGSIVAFDYDGDKTLEVCLNVYNDQVFHTLDATGTVMAYNAVDVDKVLGHIDIQPELKSIITKLEAFQQ